MFDINAGLTKTSNNNALQGLGEYLKESKKGEG